MSEAGPERAKNHAGGSGAVCPPPADTDTPPSEKNVVGGGSKVALLLVVVAAALVVFHFTPLSTFLRQTHEIKDWLHTFGWATPAVWVVIVTVLVAMGCPRLLLCPIGGLAFGFFWGLLWTQIGTLVGSFTTFLFVRWAGRDFVLRKWPKLRRYSQSVPEHGILPVLVIRQLPASGIWINSLLGLTHVGHLSFLVGTAIGTLPEAIPATLVGASATELSLGKGVAYALGAIVWFLIIGLLLRWYRRSRPTSSEPKGKQQPTQ